MACPNAEQETPLGVNIAATPRVPSVANQAADGLALWDSETATGEAGGLSVIRLDGNERLLIPFTTTMGRVTLHYVEYPALRGYVHCSGADCLHCRLGRKQDVRDLLPIYDPVEKTVGVLPIGPNMRPQALRPQVAPILRRLRDEAVTPLIAIRRDDSVTFIVSELALPADADTGGVTIRAFVEKSEAGEIDLGSVYPRLSNEELASIPEVAMALQLKGIARG
jgi:hypothetical protein